MRSISISARRALALLATLFAFVGATIVAATADGGTKATGATVVVAQAADPTTMDPHQQRETTTQNVLFHIYDTLVTRDAKDPNRFLPNLAVSWSRVGKYILRLRLKPGVTFSNGAPVSAATIKYNVDRALGKPPFKAPTLIAVRLGAIASAKVVNRLTVDISTKRPDSLVLGRLSQMMIVPTGVDPATLAANPIGTGPYTLVRWDRNNQVVLQARKDYHRGAPRIANVVFRTLVDPASRLASIQAGDVDLITNVPPDNIRDVEASGRAKVRTVPSARVASIWLDALKAGPLRNPKVRRALNYAVDREKIVANVLGGNGQAVATIVPSYFTGYNPKLAPYPYDPVKAKKLLAEAGYPKGFSMTLMVPRGRYLLGEEVTQVVAAYLGKVGVETKIDAVEFGVFAKATQTRSIPDGFYAAWGNAFFNPIDEAQVALLCGGKGFSWYCNPTYHRLIQRAAATLAPKRQASLLRAAERSLYDNPAFIYLYAYKDLYGVSQRLAWQPRRDEMIWMYEASVR